MLRHSVLAAAALCLALSPALRASEPSRPLRGVYVEARTCDVWTGPCFANADFNLGGKNAVMAWKIESGSLGGVSLEGLSVVAVVAAQNTLGQPQGAPGKAVLLVDKSATAAQRKALVRFAQQQGGELLSNVVAVQSAPITLDACECKANSCVELRAGGARIKTRCIDADHDKVCGNESAFYPPLARNVRATPAAAVEHAFRGTGLGHTWGESDRRGAYVGTFAVR